MRELPRKIVYLEMIDSLLDPDGGEHRAVSGLTRDFPWLLDDGWEVERWGLRRGNGNPYASEPSSLRGPRFPLPAFPRVLLPAVVWVTQFFQSMRRSRAGIFFAFSPEMAIGAAAARFVRRRSSVLVVRIINDVWSSRGRVLGGRRLEPRIMQALERFVLRRADLVLPIGPFTHEIAKGFGVPEERILELPRPTRWSGMEVTTPETGGPIRITAAGRLVVDKGFDVLLTAFSQIAKEFPDVQLELAGEGPERSNLTKLASSLGIEERARFLGWLSPELMQGFFSGALVSVLPSPLNEGLPTVFLEAGLAGCALIGTDVGGIRDIVHPDRTGILVRPQDPGALAEALRNLLQDPERTRRLGEGARALARAYLGQRDEAVERVRERMNALRTGQR
ncbi:MAG TPA: glycosyltransferase family 4 protein [Actinomycetota bacterium]|nr:glycosyltransferase family 4 protein [Actinomycetota bacterium]